LWLAWLAYWLAAARNVKPARRRESPASRLLTIVLTIPAAVLLAVRGPWLPWLSARFLPDTMIVYLLGLLMVVAGLAFAIWARAHLGRNWSGTVTVKENHELIRSGPYAIVRHPIYTGLLLAVLGTAIVFGEWRGLLAFCFLTIALLLKLQREERFMEESFPDTYPSYCAQVPALIPLFRGSSHGGGLSR
jgi:protein-S-isoprenylcysteine O-methyltransferase Ste14